MWGETGADKMFGQYGKDTIYGCTLEDFIGTKPLGGQEDIIFTVC